MNKKYDAIIIGAGVIGACTAFELAKKGWKTLSIDKLGDAGQGSTSSSCAIIRTYYSAFETCALAFEGWHYWKDWANHIGVEDESGFVQYKNTGCLVIKTALNHNLENVCAVMDEIGCPYEHISTKDIPSRLPGADISQFEPAKPFEDETFGEPTGPSVAGAVYFPNGGYVSEPKHAAHNAQVGAMAHGAEFMFNAEIVEIRREGNRVRGVTLASGERIDTDVVVNVAGPHSSIINKMAGVDKSMKMSTRALRHEVAHVRSPASLHGHGFVFSDSDIATYTRSDVGNNLLIGSEDPACDGHDWVDDPDNYNESFSDHWKTMVMRMAQRLPELGIPEQAKGIVALYDVSEDWMPIYDKSDLDGFYMAIGTSGNQFKNAPVAGKIMCELIEKCEAGHDHDADPIQFHLSHIDYDVSLGVFSRNREINQNSSFSVIG